MFILTIPMNGTVSDTMETSGCLTSMAHDAVVAYNSPTISVVMDFSTNFECAALHSGFTDFTVFPLTMAGGDDTALITSEATKCNRCLYINWILFKLRDLVDQDEFVVSWIATDIPLLKSWPAKNSSTSEISSWAPRPSKIILFLTFRKFKFSGRSS